MDKKHEQLEDLPVMTEQAAEVKGGGIIVIDRSVIDPSNRSVVDPSNRGVIDPTN